VSAIATPARGARCLPRDRSQTAVNHLDNGNRDFFIGAPGTMPPIRKPTLDDLCASMAQFVTCLERADPDVLEDLITRVWSCPRQTGQVASWCALMKSRGERIPRARCGCISL
jgi:hypothetical protein